MCSRRAVITDDNWGSPHSFMDIICNDITHNIKSVKLIPNKIYLYMKCNSKNLL